MRIKEDPNSFWYNLCLQLNLRETIFFSNWLACFSCHRLLLSHRYYGASHSMNHCYSCRLWSLCPIISILWSARTKHQNIIVITYINSLIVWKHCSVSQIWRTHFSVSSLKQISVSHRYHNCLLTIWSFVETFAWVHLDSFSCLSLKQVSVSLRYPNSLLTFC